MRQTKHVILIGVGEIASNSHFPAFQFTSLYRLNAAPCIQYTLDKPTILVTIDKYLE